MKETTHSTLSFYQVIELRAEFQKKMDDLINRTEKNKIWQETEVFWNLDGVTSHNLNDAIDREDLYPVDIPEIIDSAIKMYSDDPTSFYGCKKALEPLRLIQQEWRDIVNCSVVDFSSIDWSVSENRSQLIEWLKKNPNAHLLDKFEGQRKFPGIDCSACFDYEDFCLAVPSYLYVDTEELNGLYYIGLLGNIEFLLMHPEKFNCVYVFYYIQTSLGIANTVNKHPKEFLYYLNSDLDDIGANGYANYIVSSADEYSIPAELTDEYEKSFNQLKEHWWR